MVAANLISGIMKGVENGLWYVDARAKSEVVIFNAYFNGQTGGYTSLSPERGTKKT